MANPQRPTLDYRSPPPPPLSDQHDRALDRFDKWSTVGLVIVFFLFAAIAKAFVHLFLS